MFNIRKKNKYNTLLAYLIANFLTQQIFTRLKKERPETWNFLKYETVETLKQEKFRWFKKYLVIAIQDFMDIRAGRTTDKLHGKREIRRDPYIFEILELLEIKYSHSQKVNSKKILEKLINRKIKKLGISAKG